MCDDKAVDLDDDRVRDPSVSLPSFPFRSHLLPSWTLQWPVNVASLIKSSVVGTKPTMSDWVVQTDRAISWLYGDTESTKDELSMRSSRYPYFTWDG